MATKVKVLDFHQKSTDEPLEQMKRSRADLLVRRLFMEKIGPYLYRRLETKDSPIRACDLEQPRPRFIPAHMPANIDRQIGVKAMVPPPQVEIVGWDMGYSF